MSAQVHPGHQGLCVTIDQFLRIYSAYTIPTLEYQANSLLFIVRSSEAKFRHLGCCSLTCAVKEAMRHCGVFV